MPTLLAAAGDSSVKEKLLKGMKVGDRTFKNHLDGYNFLPYLKGKAKASPRHEFFYFIDRGDLYAARYDDWKISFKTVDGNPFIRRPVPANIVQYLTK